MSPKFYLIFIFLLLYICSCKKNQCPADERYSCSDGNLDVVFTGFNSFQVDSVYVVQYQKGSNFSIVGDTTKWYTQTTGNEVLLTWAPISGFFGQSYNPIDANYDSEIIIPGIKTVRFSNITISSSYYECCENAGMGCFYSVNLCPVTSYQQNGVNMTKVPAVITN